jgi:hypothetical protein
MSHGVSWAGSDVLRALYEAKRGKRKDAIDLFAARRQLGVISREERPCFAETAAVTAAGSAHGGVQLHGGAPTYDRILAKRSNMVLAGGENWREKFSAVAMRVEWSRKKALEESKGRCRESFEESTALGTRTKPAAGRRR